MTGFDPGAATAAYLSQLSPAFRRAAEIHTETAHWLWGAHLVTMLVGCWLIQRLGLMARLKDWIETGRERPWFAALACGVAFAGLMIVLSMAIEAAGAAMSDQTRSVPYGF